MAVSSKNLQEAISLAWASRMDGRSPEFLTRFSDLTKAVPALTEIVDKTFWEKVFHESKKETLFDALLLKSALWRMEKQPKRAQEFLQAFEEQLVQRSVARPFWWLFEKAILFYHDGDYFAARENFALARETARTPFERLCALSNGMHCLAQLGLPRKKEMEDVKSLLEQLKGDEYTLSTKVQYELTQRYNLFHQGKIAEASRDGKKATGSQVHYFSEWLISLPYHKQSNDKNHAEADSFSLQEKRGFLHDYRARTLQGLLHPDDTEPRRLSEWADRFYLWVWRWLVDPENFPLEKVLISLEPLLQREDLFRLSAEDRQLVRNSLLWLGLFDPSSLRHLKTFLKLVDAKDSGSYPIFDFERLVIHYWMSVRDREEALSKDYLKLIETHPLASSSGIFLGKLAKLNLIAGGPLKKLHENLLRFKQVETSGNFKVVIDMGKLTLIQSPTGKKVVSESLVRAAEAFRNREMITQENLMALCFGISEYDPEVHQPKLFNLLSRLKGVFSPHLEFRVKTGRVYCEGDWSVVDFRNADLEERQLFSQSKWREFLYSPQRVEPKPTPTTLPENVKREELETLLKMSRPTVGRLIRRWEKRGWIKRQGRSRGTYYVLSAYLRQRISDNPEGRLN